MARTRPPKKRPPPSLMLPAPPPPPPLYPVVRYVPPQQPYTPPRLPRDYRFLWQWAGVAALVALLCYACSVLFASGSWDPEKESLAVRSCRQEVDRILGEYARVRRHDASIVERIRSLSVEGDYLFSTHPVLSRHQAAVVYAGVRSHNGLPEAQMTAHEMLLKEVKKDLRARPFQEDWQRHSPAVFRANAFVQSSSVYLQRLEAALKTIDQVTSQLTRRGRIF